MIESVEDLDALTEEQLTTVSEILYALFPAGKNCRVELLGSVFTALSKANKRSKMERKKQKILEKLKVEYPDLTEEEIIYLCIHKCRTASLYLNKDDLNFL